MSRAYILMEVLEERRRQRAKWGEQNYPDGTNADWIKTRDMAQSATDAATSCGALTWLHVLYEEVCEAFAEDQPEALRSELIQVAAVAISWIEALDRREVPTT